MVGIPMKYPFPSPAGTNKSIIRLNPEWIIRWSKSDDSIEPGPLIDFSMKIAFISPAMNEEHYEELWIGLDPTQLAIPSTNWFPSCNSSCDSSDPSCACLSRIIGWLNPTHILRYVAWLKHWRSGENMIPCSRPYRKWKGCRVNSSS